ncbi:Aste57867_8579 [Aphanomyces stellatus]|uniref:Aste57867_8579 protein n=1 Tax=Aphanomyces stellatus TaxID=120398 RepID=A0A485KKU7_9STRA|nr:hypothetical protein As57867_008547 [Aphanomyces stellatus]VFT85465.1 Aste57867_8579 [Aphanomyces stellatus]
MARQTFRRQHQSVEMEPKEFMQCVMRRTLAALAKKDAYDLFSHPVDTREVPDYLDKISQPMDFSTIEQKIARHAYGSFDEFKIDVIVVFNNAQNYNMEHTIYFREAAKLTGAAAALFEEAEDSLRENRRKHQLSAAFDKHGRQDMPRSNTFASPPSPSNTQVEMETPTFDLGIRPLQPVAAEYMRDDEAALGEDFHDMCSQDLEGYATDESFVFDDVIHDPLPDTPERGVAATAPAASTMNAVVSDIDSDDDSCLSDGIEFVHEFAAPPRRRTSPPKRSFREEALPVRKPVVEKENNHTEKRPRNEWIQSKRLASDNLVKSQPLKLVTSSRPLVNGAVYKSAFGQPRPKQRQALMDLYVEPKAD